MTEEIMLELWDKSGGDIYVYADLVADHERSKCAELSDKYIGFENDLTEAILARRCRNV